MSFHKKLLEHTNYSKYNNVKIKLLLKSFEVQVKISGDKHDNINSNDNNNNNNKFENSNGFVHE